MVRIRAATISTVAFCGYNKSTTGLAKTKSPTADGMEINIVTLIALAISTILNAIYFMKTIIRIYSPVENEQPISLKIKNPVYVISIVCFVILNIVLGMWSTTIVSLIESGLSMFR